MNYFSKKLAVALVVLLVVNIFLQVLQGETFKVHASTGEIEDFVFSSPSNGGTYEDTTIKANWPDANNADYYLFYMRDLTTNDLKYNGSQTTSSYFNISSSKLTPGHQYRISVCAKNDTNSRWSNEVTFTIKEETLEKPEDPYISSPSNGGVYEDATLKVNWQNCDRADYYLYSLKDLTTGSSIYNRQSTTSSYFNISSSNLTPGHQYRVAVAAVNDAGEKWGNEVTFSVKEETTPEPATPTPTPTQEKPEDPYISTPVNGGVYADATLKVDWQSCARADSYIYSMRDLTTDTSIYYHKSTTSTYFNVSSSNLTPGHQYKVAVAAVNEAGEKWGNEVTFSIKEESTPKPATPTPAPTQEKPEDPYISTPVNGGVYADATLKVDWQNCDRADSYIYSLRDLTTDTSIYYHKSTTSSYFNISASNLTPDHQYKVAVAAINEAGKKWGNEVTFSIKENNTSEPTVNISKPVISSPSNGATITKDGSTYKVNWNDVDGAVKYFYTVRKNNSGSSVYLEGNSGVTSSYVNLDTDVLEYDTSYTIYVSATDANGNNSGLSSGVTIVTSKNTVPTTISKPVISSPSNRSTITKDGSTFKADWNDVDGVVRYYYTVKKNGVGNTVIADGNKGVDSSQVYIDTDDLEYGAMYTIEVSASDKDGNNSGLSDPLTIYIGEREEVIIEEPTIIDVLPNKNLIFDKYESVNFIVKTNSVVTRVDMYDLNNKLMYSKSIFSGNEEKSWLFSHEMNTSGVKNVYFVAYDKNNIPSKKISINIQVNSTVEIDSLSVNYEDGEDGTILLHAGLIGDFNIVEECGFVIYGINSQKHSSEQIEASGKFSVNVNNLKAGVYYYKPYIIVAGKEIYDINYSTFIVSSTQNEGQNYEIIDVQYNKISEIDSLHNYYFEVVMDGNTDRIIVVEGSFSKEITTYKLSENNKVFYFDYSIEEGNHEIEIIGVKENLFSSSKKITIDVENNFEIPSIDLNTLVYNVTLGKDKYILIDGVITTENSDDEITEISYSLEDVNSSFVKHKFSSREVALDNQYLKIDINSKPFINGGTYIVNIYAKSSKHNNMNNFIGQITVNISCPDINYVGFPELYLAENLHQEILIKGEIESYDAYIKKVLYSFDGNNYIEYYKKSWASKKMYTIEIDKVIDLSGLNARYIYIKTITSDNEGIIKIPVSYAKLVTSVIGFDLYSLEVSNDYTLITEKYINNLLEKIEDDDIYYEVEDTQIAKIVDNKLSALTAGNTVLRTYIMNNNVKVLICENNISVSEVKKQDSFTTFKRYNIDYELYRGVYCYEVVKLQTMLNKVLNNITLVVDGKFGKNTSDALQEFKNSIKDDVTLNQTEILRELEEAAMNKSDIYYNKETTWDSRHTDERIKSLHPSIQSEVIAFINAAEANGYYLRVNNDGHFRSFAEQEAIYGKGRDENGNVINKKEVVSNAKGGQSYHNYGLAFDVSVINIETGQVDPSGVTQEIADIASKYGFYWGGNFTNKDRPHFQQTYGKHWSKLMNIYRNGERKVENISLDELLN